MIDGASLDDGGERTNLAAMTRGVVHCLVQAFRTLRDHQQIGDKRFVFAIDTLGDEGVVERSAPRDGVTVAGNTEQTAQQRMNRVAALFDAEVEHRRRMTRRAAVA